MKRRQGIAVSAENRIEAVRTPGKPYEHTLTPADRIAFQKWLMGTSAFCGLAVLVMIGVAIARHDRTATAENETAAAVRSGTQDSLCLGRSKRDTRLVRKEAATGGDDDVVPGCI